MPKGADSLYGVGREWGVAARTMRMLEGKAEVVGVAGRTLMELWGERVGGLEEGRAEDWMEVEVEEVEEALECECAWWMLRMEETDEEVDLRPRRPCEERR